MSSGLKSLYPRSLTLSQTPTLSPRSRQLSGRFRTCFHVPPNPGTHTGTSFSASFAPFLTSKLQVFCLEAGEQTEGRGAVSVFSFLGSLTPHTSGPEPFLQRKAGQSLFQNQPGIRSSETLLSLGPAEFLDPTFLFLWDPA